MLLYQVYQVTAGSILIDDTEVTGCQEDLTQCDNVGVHGAKALMQHLFAHVLDAAANNLDMTSM